ncbi:UDP-N-acetyl glucosamine 2-epimerase [Timonella senegalensis]|uniref:UDP-N-acetyl glucosamine 2-epimerase n=3 Tax=Timonella senegalensis TaxID=1465825 RepID=UPI002FE23FD9
MIPYADRTRVLVVFGTRPEAIKMIPVIRALQDSGLFRPVVVSTGQHTDMVEDLITASGLRLDVNLRASAPMGDRRPTLNEVVARIITGVDRVWSSEELPSEYQDQGRRSVHGAKVCLVHGDTSSALAAALAAFNLQIPVVHVEAGLRTSNLLSPFPEEGNRQLISRIAALHLAPTTSNKMNLVREGVDYDRVLVTGNTSIDMLQWATEQQGGFGPGLEELEAKFLAAASPEAVGTETRAASPEAVGTETPAAGEPSTNPTTTAPADLPTPPRLVLVTAHRRENWGAGLANIAAAIKQLASKYPDTQFVVPMHPNPLAREPMLAALSDEPNAHLVGPRDYLAFARLMAAATIIITDSGGVQEEAPALGTPVLVARDTTERQEGVEAGTLLMVGTDPARIVSEASRLLDDDAEYSQRSGRVNPYGDGRASERIVAALEHIFLEGKPAEDFQTGGMRSAVLRRLGLDSLEDAEPARV